MGHLKTGKGKSRIAARTRIISMLLLLLVLVLITAATTVMVTRVTNSASENFARLYSIETVEKFDSFLARYLLPVHLVSGSKPVTEWFTDEENQQKKSDAYDGMRNYTNMLQNPLLYFVIDKSLNEYSVSGDAALNDIVPFDRLDLSVPYNQWYTNCVHSKDEYTLNIDIDKVTNTAHLWINHKVMNGGNIAGVFCSGIPLDEAGRNLFAKYDTVNIKGYIIDKNGYIRMNNNPSNSYYTETNIGIPETASNPALASAVAKYLKNINSYFDANTQPEVLNLGKGAYKFVSIAPIAYSDWSVVTFFNSKSLFSVTNLLPLLALMLSAFLLYSLAINAVMRRFLIAPINRLKRSVSEDETGTGILSGHERDDEIGDLARTIRNVSIERQYQEQLLHAVNSAASMLLATADEENFNSSLQEGMGIMGRCVDADRVYILQNELINGERYFAYRNEWMSETGKQGATIPRGARFPYSLFFETEAQFSRDKSLNGPISELPREVKEFFSRIDIKSILVIPVFIQEEFWGFVSFSDCRTERTFTEDEVNILRSGSLMMVSALNRNIQAVRLQENRVNTQILLDAMPFACELWNRDGTIFDCNEKALELFKVPDKKSYVGNFFDYSAKYQADGQLATEIGMIYLDRAFEEGRLNFEWIRQSTDGTLIPTDVTLVRVKFGDRNIVVGYARDLSMHKQMMNEIEQRDNLLNTVNSAATTLLQSETGEFKNSLYGCMDKLAGAIDADRIYIWKNHEKDGKIYCTQLFEWSEGAEPQQNNKFTVDVSYSEAVPGWEEILSRGDCVNGLIRDMSPEIQAQMLPQGIKSVLTVPVIVRNEFWGFVGYDNCHSERLFTKNEESILRSASLLMASSWLRQDITLNIRATAAKLEAVIANYPGIIWCVDNNSIITLFNGRYLNELNLKPSFFEGKNYNEVLQDDRFQSIRTSVQKTFAEGAQDFNFETGDRMYRLRTTPIHDEVHGLVSVIGNFDDITERNRLQAELRTALAAAQDASNAKSDFLANMSHEMRTPLNAVIGLSELTLCSDKLAGECYSNLEKINNAGVTLLNMVNDILDISKIESGKFQLIPVDYDTPSLLNDTINQSILYIGEKPIDFILNIDQNLPLRLYGDDLRIKQILNNLLSNAFKYTAEGKVELSVHCERDGSAVWFTASVADSGIGIRKEDIGNLFKDYAQMDIRAHRKIVGTGLGLPITKKIIDIMNGSITVESEYGKGSIFTVRFPQQYVTDEIIGEDVAGSLKNFSYSDQKRRTNSRMTRMRLPYANVLVVDDVATNLDVAKGMMKPYGMKIDCVLSGQEAIDAIRDEKVKYNAVFMDHMMPEMDGIEAVRRIREEIGTEYSRTIPIIALTANAIAGNEEMFLSKGFQAFISKPVETEHLDAVIREFVRDRKQEEALGLINVSGQMLVNIRSGSDRRICINRRSGINRRELKKASPWIDIDRGIQSFGGDRESYMQVLRSFASATRGLLDTVRGVSSEHLANYAIAVHGIKGSSRSVHIKSIGDRAEALEKAAKEGNFGFVSANNGIFADELEKLLDNLDDLLGQIDPERPKPKKDKPDTKALERLQAACTAYDMDEVDAAMSEIESFEYNSDNGLALWLRENVDQMNFTEITEKLPARSG